MSDLEQRIAEIEGTVKAMHNILLDAGPVSALFEAYNALCWLLTELRAVQAKSNARRDALRKTQYQLQKYTDGSSQVDCIGCGRHKSAGCSPACYIAKALSEE